MAKQRIYASWNSDCFPVSGTFSYLFGNLPPVWVTNDFTLSGSYFIDSSASIEDVDYDSFCQDLKRTLEGKVADVFTCTFDPDTKKISIQSTNFSYAFNFNENGRLITGIPNRNVTSSLHTSSNVPYFFWEAKESGIVNDSAPYEQDPIFRQKIRHDGTQATLGRTGVSKVRDFEFVNEDSDNVYNNYSSSTKPYTWQRHKQHCRSYRPWLLFSGSELGYHNRFGTYKFREDGALFRPQKYFEQMDNLWTLQAKTRELSRPSGAAAIGPVSASFCTLTGAFACYRADLSYSASVDGIWYDQSVELNHLTQSTSLYSFPTASAVSSLNGQDALYFSGTAAQKVFIRGTYAGSTFADIKPYYDWPGFSLVFVGQFNKDDRGNYFIDYGNAAEPYKHFSLRKSVYYGQIDFVVSGALRLTTTTRSIGEPVCIIATYNSASTQTRLYRNGVLQTEGTLESKFSIANSSSADIIIGGELEASKQAEFLGSEFQFFTRELTKQEIAETMNYVESRYAITNEGSKS